MTLKDLKYCEWIEGEAFSYDEMLNFADEALYEAKRNRKGFYIENNQV